MVIRRNFIAGKKLEAEQRDGEESPIEGGSEAGDADHFQEVGVVENLNRYCLEDLSFRSSVLGPFLFKNEQEKWKSDSLSGESLLRKLIYFWEVLVRKV